MRFLRVTNLEKYQHYKERRPPWVKLHRTVFADYAFSRLRDASKAHLMLLWLLASEHDNKLPDDPEWLARKIDANSPVDVSELVSAGFLEVYEDDSITLAPRLHDESKRGSTEDRGQRTETETALVAQKPLRTRVIAPTTPGVAEVMAHYRGAHPRRRPGPKEAKLIERALGWGYAPSELCEAIDGNARDEWHIARGKHDLSYVLRDTGHIDNALALAVASAPKLAVDPVSGIPNAAGILALGGRP